MTRVHEAPGFASITGCERHGELAHAFVLAHHVPRTCAHDRVGDARDGVEVGEAKRTNFALCCRTLRDARGILAAVERA